MNKKESFFLNSIEEEALIKSIKEAERQTSGEIRVHVEPACGTDVFARALEVFANLEMHRTKAQNAVLFYLAYKKQKFAIVADEGINQSVPENFWDKIKDEMQESFKEGAFLKGLQLGIDKTGEKLKQYFPFDPLTDQNELSDDISKGKED